MRNQNISISDANFITLLFQLAKLFWKIRNKLNPLLYPFINTI